MVSSGVLMVIRPSPLPEVPLTSPLGALRLSRPLMASASVASTVSAPAAPAPRPRVLSWAPPVSVSRPVCNREVAGTARTVQKATSVDRRWVHGQQRRADGQRAPSPTAIGPADQPAAPPADGDLLGGRDGQRPALRRPGAAVDLAPAGELEPPHLHADIPAGSCSCFS